MINLKNKKTVITGATGGIGNSIIEKFINWDGKADNNTEITFYPSRVIMQDFTGVPAVVDLASMRDAMKSLDASKTDAVNPQCQTDLVIDHSVMVDEYASGKSFSQNVEKEFSRNGREVCIS